jgi:hypothetical protein
MEHGGASTKWVIPSSRLSVRWGNRHGLLRRAALRLLGRVKIVQAIASGGRRPGMAPSPINSQIRISLFAAIPAKPGAVSQHNKNMQAQRDSN